MQEEKSEPQEEKKEEPLDASFQYEKRLKRFKPLSYILLAIIAVGLITPFILYAFGLERYFIYSLALAFFPLVVSIWPVYQSNKCPVCKKYMGRILGSNCPHCKCILRKEQNSPNSQK